MIVLVPEVPVAIAQTLLVPPEGAMSRLTSMLDAGGNVDPTGERVASSTRHATLSKECLSLSHNTSTYAWSWICASSMVGYAGTSASCAGTPASSGEWANLSSTTPIVRRSAPSTSGGTATRSN
jgi:hypothetical protein